MKKSVIGFTLTMFIASAPLVRAAGGNTWSALSQQWNRIQNSQKKQSDHFEVLEREAARVVNDLKYGGTINKPKQMAPHYCSHCGRLHAAAHYCSYCGRLHQ